MSGHGSWYSLLEIVREAADPSFRDPPGTECPNDGTTLIATGDGWLHCPFDGWVGTPEQAMPPGIASAIGAGDVYTATYTAVYG